MTLPFPQINKAQCSHWTCVKKGGQHSSKDEPLCYFSLQEGSLPPFSFVVDFLFTLLLLVGCNDLLCIWKVIATALASCFAVLSVPSAVHGYGWVTDFVHWLLNDYGLHDLYTLSGFSCKGLWEWLGKVNDNITSTSFSLSDVFACFSCLT